MNLVDLFAIIPFYLTIFLNQLEDVQIIGKAGKVIRLVKSKIKQSIKIFKKKIIDFFISDSDNADTSGVQAGPPLCRPPVARAHATPGNIVFFFVEIRRS